MEKKEVTGIWLPPRQGQWAPHHWKGAAMGTGSASLNMRSPCLKREVEICETDRRFQMYSLKEVPFSKDGALKEILLIPSRTLLWKT